MAKQDWETDGTRNGRAIYCPENECDCPYYGDGICHIDNPIEDCGDFNFFWESWEEWDNA